MSRLAVERIPAEAILMPSVYYAFNVHHLDFPGTIAVEGDTFINYVTDIGKSLAHHGFRKILLVNGMAATSRFWISRRATSPTRPKPSAPWCRGGA
jgi:hypothetical protein